MASKGSTVISPDTFKVYHESEIPFDGYVRGVGRVDTMYKSYDTIPIPNAYNCQNDSVSSIDFESAIDSSMSSGIVNLDTIPSGVYSGYNDSISSSIGYIPVLDSSKANVIRSYGEDANKILYDSLVVPNGNSVIVNLGNSHITIDSSVNYQIDCKIDNLYEDTATFTINVKYQDNNGLWVTAGERRCKLDDIDREFTNMAQLNPVDDSAVDGFINQVYNVAHDYVAPVGSVLSIPVSADEYLRKIDHLRDVKRYFEQDMIRIPAENEEILRENLNKLESQYSKKINSLGGVKKNNIKVNRSVERINGSQIEKLKFKNVQQAVRYGNTKQRLNLEYAEKLNSEKNAVLKKTSDDLSKKYVELVEGTDSRVKSNFNRIKLAARISKGLNILGAGISVWSLGKHLYDNRGNADALLSLKTLRLGLDLAFSLVAFVPGWGWAVSGAWFLGTAIYDYYNR